jgi:hypothetical protein
MSVSLFRALSDFYIVNLNQLGLSEEWSSIHVAVTPGRDNDSPRNCVLMQVLSWISKPIFGTPPAESVSAAGEGGRVNGLLTILRF